MELRNMGAASFGILNVQEHSKNITLPPSFIIQEYSGVVLITLLHEQDHHRLSKNIVFREHSVSRISPSFAILCILVLFTPISHSLNLPRTYVINEICNVSRILDLIHQPFSFPRLQIFRQTTSDKNLVGDQSSRIFCGLHLSGNVLGQSWTFSR